MPAINAERLLADLCKLRSFGACETGVVRPSLPDIDMRAGLCCADHTLIRSPRVAGSTEQWLSSMRSKPRVCWPKTRAVHDAISLVSDIAAFVVRCLRIVNTRCSDTAMLHHAKHLHAVAATAPGFHSHPEITPCRPRSIPSSRCVSPPT